MYECETPLLGLAVFLTLTQHLRAGLPSGALGGLKFPFVLQSIIDA